MSASADKFGSLSNDAYRASGTITVIGSDTVGIVETDPADFLGNTGINENQPTKVYNPSAQDGSDLTTDGTQEDAPPTANSFWDHGRDYYANAGMPAQTFFRNSQTGQ